MSISTFFREEPGPALESEGKALMTLWRGVPQGLNPALPPLVSRRLTVTA
jgi:hypothetical protein